LDDIREITKRRRLGLFGHVARLQPEFPASSVLGLLCCKWRHSSSTWLASLTW